MKGDPFASYPTILTASLFPSCKSGWQMFFLINTTCTVLYEHHQMAGLAFINHFMIVIPCPVTILVHLHHQSEKNPHKHYSNAYTINWQYTWLPRKHIIPCTDNIHIITCAPSRGRGHPHWQTQTKGFHTTMFCRYTCTPSNSRCFLHKACIHHITYHALSTHIHVHQLMAEKFSVSTVS